jgi:hypothetical protein
MYNLIIMPQYPKPIPIVIQLLWSGIFRRKLSFHDTAQYCIKRLNPPLKIFGQENIPQRGPLLLVTNHYTHPGFPSWWISLSTSSVVPFEIHWIMAGAWTSPDPLYTRIITPITFWAFARLAWVYGFTPMPPMPPRPTDFVARALAVRQILSYVHTIKDPLVGLAPEGQDEAADGLIMPPNGVGRFIYHLTNAGLDILPIGVFEQDDQLCVHFGPSYHLNLTGKLTTDEKDILIRKIVMSSIATLLPHELRGIFR